MAHVAMLVTLGGADGLLVVTEHDAVILIQRGGQHLRRWRSRKTISTAYAVNGQQRLDALHSEINRLEAQIAELRQVHLALRETLATCQCTRFIADQSYS